MYEAINERRQINLKTTRDKQFSVANYLEGTEIKQDKISQPKKMS